MNILATWRLTELLVNERGFYAIFDKVREYAYDNRDFSNADARTMPKVRFWNEIFNMLECRYCTSVTVGIALAIVTKQNVLWGFAYSAGALLFGRIFEQLEQ